MKELLISYIIASLIILAIPEFFVYNTTASLPQGLYIRAFSAEIRQGQIVRFKLKQTYHYSWLTTSCLLKEAAGVAGDHVSVSEKGYYINDRYLGSVLQTDTQGNPLPVYRFEGSVPAGYILVAGHGNSFDSRYFGPVAISGVQVFRQLFTR